VTEADAVAVRREIALLWLAGESEDALLGGAPPCAGGEEASGARDGWVGEVRLRAHQRSAVVRVQRSIEEFGGALLADEVGLGKTYVALAVMARMPSAARACVVAPAALREMWAGAMRRAGVRAEFVSVEALSRGRGSEGVFDVVVFDEAHHLRNPATRRYHVAGVLSRRARVLLLSATPVHNRRDDLAALLALFLGSRAWSLGEEELSRCIVRRSHEGVRGAELVPAVRPVEWLEWLPSAGGEPLARGDLLEEILALPPPVPPCDGGDGGALVSHALVRQWASSDGALRAALKRRLARATALEGALAEGRRPTRAELRAWAYADDTVQLAFPELMAASCEGAERLLPVVRAHAAALGALLGRVTPARDQARAAALRTLRARRAGERIVAFSAFADTVASLFRELRADGEVAALTARGAVVAGGTLTREEAIARFAPEASGTRPPDAAHRISLLLTTDLLSEGVNLQDASVVVHLDLPWTPARLAQRVGRVARIGSPHRCVSVYALAPPASAERLLAVERRLRQKARVATRAVGVAGTILPPLVAVGHPPASSPPELAERLRARMRVWADPTSVPGPPEAVGVPSRDATMVGAVAANRAGLLALYLDGTTPLLVAGQTPDEGSSMATNIGATTDLQVVADVVAAADGPSAAVDLVARERAIASLARWQAARQIALDIGLRANTSGRARRRVIERIARIVRRAAHHRRPLMAALAAAARHAALLPCGAGAERVLGELADAAMADDAWLRAVGAFGEMHARADPGDPGGASGAAANSGPRLRALLLLQPRRVARGA